MGISPASARSDPFYEMLAKNRMPLIRTPARSARCSDARRTTSATLVSLQLVDESSAPVLREIRLHNPLLFDLALKRRLSSNGKSLAARVFETRCFFEG